MPCQIAITVSKSAQTPNLCQLILEFKMSEFVKPVTMPSNEFLVSLNSMAVESSGVLNQSRTETREILDLSARILRRVDRELSVSEWGAANNLDRKNKPVFHRIRPLIQPSLEKTS